jgi:hypothetical protein
MQHDEHPPPADDETIALVPAPLDRPAVLHELWPCLGTDDRRALRRGCATLRDAVDAHAGCVEGQADSPVLSLVACDRLVGVHTATLRSMACLRGMLMGNFPLLQSLRVHLVGEIFKCAMHAMRSCGCVLHVRCQIRVAPRLHGCMGGCMHQLAQWDARLAFPREQRTANAPCKRHACVLHARSHAPCAESCSMRGVMGCHADCMHQLGRTPGLASPFCHRRR